MRLTRVPAAVAALAVALPALAGAPALPAAAAAPAAAVPRLMLSDDGAVWERHLSSSLFGDRLLLVPGGSATESFWVKNLSDVPAVLRTSVADVRSSSPALTRWLSVSTTPLETLGGTTTVALGDGTCTGSTTATVLGGGDAVLLDVGLALDERATEGSAGQAVDFTVLVTLTGVVAEAPPAAGCATPDDEAVGTVPAVGPGASGPVRPGSGGTGGELTAGSGGAGGAADGSGPDRGAPPADGSSDLGTDPADPPVAHDEAVLVPTGGGDLRTAGVGPPRPFSFVAPFVPVPLRGAWLPVAAALVAVLVGGAVAVLRRRRDEGDAAAAEPTAPGPGLAGGPGAVDAGPTP
ncbi:hypothetical protein [Frigoribacterium salinisoli]